MHIPRACTSLWFAASLAIAQTTGVPGINHYTIMGGGAICNGSPSCTSCCFFTPVTLACNVSTAPGNLVIILWSFCPCTAGFLCGPINACVPAIPSTACTSTTNQSFDLALGCVMTTFVGVANATGNATVNVSFPALGPATPCSIGPLGTQAVVFDPCGLGVTIFPGPFVATQAYDVSFW